ncbi:hypothetical protein BKA70DRAFT_1233425 [Coprinopsis sp. MPI-PUGE-AT-0042]|nr:hypothetical protein BKA70DRAFT_1233425 [Coprinopsis sp. MPI-PUGE-AT-0042]
MFQSTFLLAAIPFILPALAANVQVRNNGGAVTSSTLGVVTSIVATATAPGGTVSSSFASPAFPTVDGTISSSFAVPAIPTSYFNCGGSNFTITGSAGATGVTTVTFGGATGTGAIATTYATPIISTRLAARDGVVSSSINGGEGATTTASSFLGGGGTTATGSSLGDGATTTAQASSNLGGTASGACPLPTSTVYASSPAMSSVSPGGTAAAAAQLGDTGAAQSGMAVGAGVLMGGAVAGILQFFL